MRGSHLPHNKFSLQLGKFLLSYAMRIMFGMFLFAFWVIRTPKCEVVIFPKFQLACMHAGHLKYIGMPILLKACTPCVHVCHACPTQHH